jgi:hypothetical protein
MPVSRHVVVTALIGLLGLAAVGVIVYVGAERAKPRTETVAFEYTVWERPTKTVLKLQDVQTADGQWVRAWVPIETDERVPVVKKGTREETYELPSAERLRLNIVMVCAIIGGVFLLILILIFAWRHCKKVPKPVDDWLNRLVSAAVGAALAFVGVPASQGQLTAGGQPPIAATAPVLHSPSGTDEPPPEVRAQPKKEMPKAGTKPKKDGGGGDGRYPPESDDCEPPAGRPCRTVLGLARCRPTCPANLRPLNGGRPVCEHYRPLPSPNGSTSRTGGLRGRWTPTARSVGGPST